LRAEKKTDETVNPEITGPATAVRGKGEKRQVKAKRGEERHHGKVRARLKGNEGGGRRE